MKIRFNHPAIVRFTAQVGDELTVSAMTPEIETILRGVRVDGVRLAEIIEGDEDELAVATPQGETAVIGRGRRGQRTAPVSV